MMKKYLFFALLTAFLGVGMQAQTIFSAVSPSSHTLYYRVIDADSHYVAVTCPNEDLLEGEWPNYDALTAGALWGTGNVPSGNLIIPSTVTYVGSDYTVRAIGRGAFLRCPLLSVTMPNTIDSICDRAFWACNGLSNVTFSNTLRYIGIAAFADTYVGASGLTMPSSLRVLKEVCFGNAHVSSITLNEGLEVIEVHCLSSNQIESLYIPASVKQIQSPCWYMSSLSTIVVDPANPYFDSRNDCNAIVNNMGEVVQACFGTVLPEGITRLWGDAFRGYRYERFVVPSTVINMGFHDCQIGTLVVSSPLVSLDFWANSIDTIEIHSDTPPVWIGTPNSDTRYGTPIKVPCDAIASFQAANVWRDFTNYVGVYPYRVTAQGDGHGIVQVVQPTCAVPTAMLTAVPAGGYHFVQWSDGVYDNPRSLSLVGDSVLTATFAPTDTVHVTIAEGESYLGHTTAGIYLDTIAGFVPDSIICSLVSLVVNRPMDNCEVQVVYEVPGLRTPSGIANGPATASYKVMPSSQLSVPVFLNVSLDPAANTYDSQNLVTNGDFEQDNTYPYVGDYATDDGDGYGSRTYGIQEGNGVDGSRCMWFGGSSLPDQALFRITIPSEIGSVYRFSYSALATIYNMPYFSVRVNGQQIDNNDIVSQENQWFTFTHDFVATSSSTLVELVDLNTDWNGNDFLIDNISLIQVSNPASDSITITNIHGLVYDTMDIAIAEGQTYRGHTLAGVYQDTILGTDADSIIHSRVSMTVDRPLDNCMVQLGGNIAGAFYAEGDAVEVLPGSSKQILVLPMKAGNLLENGDFEQGETGYTTQYTHTDCGGAGCGYNTINVCSGCGVDGSMGLGLDGAVTEMVIYEATIPNAAHGTYRFNYMAKNTGSDFPPYFAVLVNGAQVGDIDYTPQNSEWVSFEHTFTFDGGDLVLQIFDRCLEGGGNDFYMDNFSLKCLVSSIIIPDTVTVTNTHGLVRDTVDVNINEDGSYHGHTLAGVYRDTVIGSATDSIVYARVSMNINHTFGEGSTTLATDQEGRVWMGLDDNSISTQQEMTVQVPPTTEQRYVLTSLADGSNMQPNGDLEQGQYVNWSTDYTWGDTPFQGSHYFTVCDTCGRTGKGIAAKGSLLMNKYVYTSEWVSLVKGHRYSFSYWAKSRPTNPAQLAVAINDQQQEWRLDETDNLTEAIGEWKLFEHVFTASRTYASLLRIIDLNTSENGNEFFLDDISIVDLTEAADAQRDTVSVRNIHQLVYTTVDTTIEEGENYNGYTTAGVYNDTTVYADYDSIVRTRVSYILNYTGEGKTSLANNTGETIVDLDNGTIYTGDSIAVLPMQARHFGILTEGRDTNMVVNGDFEQGNMGFSSYYMHRPLPYSLDDETFCIGGYRIDQFEGNNYFHAVYNHANNGPAYCDTISVEPNTWYVLSYKAVANVCYSDQGNMGPLFHVDVNGNEISTERFHCTNYTDFYATNGCGDVNDVEKRSHLVYSDGSTMSIALRHANEDYWGWYIFAYDDITLTPLAISDTITVTNRHQIVYATVDTTINEGENYNGYTLAGVYQDTVFTPDYDSIVRTRVSMTVNRPLDNCLVQLDGNINGSWFSDGSFVANGNNIALSVAPSESRQMAFYPNFYGTNFVVNGDFEQDNTYPYVGDYATDDGDGYGSRTYGIQEGNGVDGSRSMWFGGSSLPDQALFRITIPSEIGSVYRFSYSAFATIYNMPYFSVKVNGHQIDNNDIVSQENQWFTFTHDFVATSSSTLVELVDLNTEWNGNDFLIDNISLIQVSIPVGDTITITNTHGLVRDTVDVTIAEGESYHGHTLAGVYQDTILGTDADSIIRSRVSMTVDRPLDNCEVQLGSNITGNWYIDGTFIAHNDNIALPVIPSEIRQVMFYPGTYGTNCIENGDFENSNIEAFITDYATPDSPGSAYRTYSYQGGVGVDGSNGVNFDGSTIANQAVISVTKATEPGCGYSFSYMARNTGNEKPPYFQVKVNGVPQEGTDVIPLDGNVWTTFTHNFIATTTATTIDIVDLCLQGNGNDFYLDNISLVQTTTNHADSITITNTHGLIFDTVDVTIAEGQTYRGHTMAGVYQDTVIGSATDSIVYARVSMNINHTFGEGRTTLATDLEGRVWMGLDDNNISIQQEMTVQVPPATEQRYVLTSLADGSNLQPNGDLEHGQYVNWSTDYAWGDTPFQGSHYFTVCETCGRTGKGIAAKGSGLENRYVYTSEWVNLVEGHRYSFSYWAKSHSGNPAQLAVDLNDQQYTYRIADTADLGEAINEWKCYEHIFTASRTYASLLRITDLNTSENGNEFFLDDISIVDLTEAADTRRDTVVVRNTHHLHYATVDVTINEGQSYNGHTTAGVYTDTTVYADYDSIVRTRVSYILNTTGQGMATLSSYVEGTWIDLDNNSIYDGDSISVLPTEVRTFGLLSPAQDTNLIVNGDFKQGNTGFTSHFLYRPEPYDLGDGTYYIGGYRILNQTNNHYLYAFNYWEPRQGAPYETSVSVTPGTWYQFSYRGVSNALRGDVAVHPYGNDNTVKVNGQLIGIDTLTYSSSVDISQAETFTHYFFNASDTTMNIELNTNYGETYNFAYDDITLTPLAVSDTVTVTNRHQIVYTTVDTTLNEGENYNGYTQAGVYVDTTYLADYDSITRTRVNMIINSLDGVTQLGGNQMGMWIGLPDNTAVNPDSVTVPPMQSRQYVFDGYVATGNQLTNGDFEQGLTGFTSQYNYSESCVSCGPNNYAIVSGYGINGSSCLSFDGSETYGTVLYEQTVPALTGASYRFAYQATTNGVDNSNPAYFEVLVNGTAIGTLDNINTNPPSWTSFEHTFVANSNSITLQIIDRNTESSGNDCLIDELVLEVVGGGSMAVNDTITVTNRHQLVYDTTRVDLCQGSHYEADGQSYSSTGTYALATQLYVDSTVYPTLVLTMHDNYYPQLSANICEDESYTFAGNALNATGTYVDSLTSVWGCDSLITLSLNVYNHTASVQTENVCDSYTWHGTTYTTSTVAYDTIANLNGCDSICTLNLTVRHSTTGDTAATACDAFQWYGQTYAVSGSYPHLLSNSVGCDSTLTMALTVNYSSTGSETHVVCDSMTWHGILFNQSGTYSDTLTNSVACDSVVTLNLTVNPTYHHTDAVFACDNHLPYLYQGTPLTVAGVHEVVFQSARNCDSIVSVTLTVGATYQHDDALTLCQSGMPYTYGERTFTPDDANGEYVVPFTTMEGCDSIVTLDLTVHESEATEIYVVTVQNIHNVVVWEQEAAVEHYNIYRESSTSGSYSLMAEVPFDGMNMWVDSTSDARARSYRYRISSTDSCGVESEPSDIHRTMHLTISQGINGSWNLVWTEYEGTLYSTYRIYRGNSYNNLTMIDEIPAANTTYTDYNAPEGDVYYQITILLNPVGSKDALPNTINSNIATNSTEVGIEDVQCNGTLAYIKDGDIVVESRIGEQIHLYDVTGRELHSITSTGVDRFCVPTSGTYLVKVGKQPIRRVVVIK